MLIPREDAWAYTPQHIAAVQRARAQAKADADVFPDALVQRLGN